MWSCCVHARPGFMRAGTRSHAKSRIDKLAPCLNPLSGSAVVWTQVEKKRYYSLFKLAGFNGFDGKSLLLTSHLLCAIYVRCHRMPAATACLPSVAVVRSADGAPTFHASRAFHAVALLPTSRCRRLQIDAQLPAASCWRSRCGGSASQANITQGHRLVPLLAAPVRSCSAFLTSARLSYAPRFACSSVQLPLHLPYQNSDACHNAMSVREVRTAFRQCDDDGRRRLAGMRFSIGSRRVPTNS